MELCPHEAGSEVFPNHHFATYTFLTQETGSGPISKSPESKSPPGLQACASDKRPKKRPCAVEPELPDWAGTGPKPARGPDHQHEAELLPWVSFTRRPQASRREDCSQAFPPLVRPSGPQVVGSLQEGQGSLAQWEQSGHQTSLPPLHVWVLLTPTTLSYRRVRGQAPCLPADVTGCCLRGWWERETTLLLLLGPVLVTGGSASLAAA